MMDLWGGYNYHLSADDTALLDADALSVQRYGKWKGYH